MSLLDLIKQNYSYFLYYLLHKGTMSILVPKSLLFMSNIGPFFSTENSKFLSWIHIKYFHLGIYVTPRACLIRKYGSQSWAFFLYFNASRGTVHYLMGLGPNPKKILHNSGKQIQIPRF